MHRIQALILAGELETASRELRAVVDAVSGQPIAACASLGVSHVTLRRWLLALNLGDLPAQVRVAAGKIDRRPGHGSSKRAKLTLCER